MTALLALSGALIIGGADFVAGLVSRRESPARVTVWVQSGSLLTVLVAVWFIGAERITRTDVIAGVVAGLSGGFSFIAFYAALARGAMGRVTPVTAIVGALIPSLVGVARGESLGPLTLLGGLIGLLAIALVTQESADPQHRSTPSSAFVLAAVAGAGFSIFFLALSATSSEAGLWPLVYARLTSVPATLTIAWLATRRIRMDRQATLRSLGTGAVEMIANVLALLAFQRGPLVIATVMSSFYPLSTVILARVFIGERLRRIQAIGVILGIVSIPLIAVG